MRCCLEAEVLQAQKMELVGRLAGGVAHDFNNMLGVILGHTELAVEQLEATAPLREHLDEIHDAAVRSAALTRQLLAFARKQPTLPRVLDLNNTLRGMAKMLDDFEEEEVIEEKAVWPKRKPILSEQDPALMRLKQRQRSANIPQDGKAGVA